MSNDLKALTKAIKKQVSDRLNSAEIFKYSVWDISAWVKTTAAGFPPKG